jgi:F-type H+-transporting ATPase subunit delta
MATSGVARRYARAVFDIASEEHNLDGWLRDLRAIQSLFEEPNLAAYLSSPAVPREAKLRQSAEILKSFGEKQRNFVSVLIQNERGGIIPSIVTAFQDELDRSRGIVHAQVTTAIPLKDDEVADVRRGLEGVTGRLVVMTTAVDPGIVGGFVARIGDQLIDASVVGRLQALRASLMA